MTVTFRALFGAFGLLAAVITGVPANAGETTVAVAANFTAAAEEIGKAFETASGHKVTYSFGSTGQLFTQIAHGAPFEVFLAADQARPEKAEADGLAVEGTRFTYATGRLVLWSADANLIDGTPDILKDPKLAHVAIANPVTAPYGAAAMEVMEALGLTGTLKPKLVEGKNIAQAYQFVATGNAPVGFVAFSQVVKDDSGSRWSIPSDLYTPIRQDAVLLKNGGENEAAKAYLEFLKGEEARKIIESFGYGVGG